MSKLAQIHTYPPSLAKSKIMVKTFSLYHTGPVTCNSYFRHFESRLTVKKKITITVSFSQKETKTAPKGQYYFVYSVKDFPALVFSLQFQIILKVFWRLPKMSGSIWSLQVEEKSKNSPLYFPCEEYIFYCRECVDKIFFRFSENILHALNSVFFENSKLTKLTV